jgi:hypothetical protein
MEVHVVVDLGADRHGAGSFALNCPVRPSKQALSFKKVNFWLCNG